MEQKRYDLSFCVYSRMFSVLAARVPFATQAPQPRTHSPVPTETITRSLGEPRPNVQKVSIL